MAFFVQGRDGEARPVAGSSVRDAPVSVADGWTQDGRAIVELPRGACGTSLNRPGIYLISLDGQRTFLAPLPRSPGP